MTGNQTLANFDMVLGLSEATINYQFSQLQKRNIIHKNWAILAGNVLNPKKGDKAFFITNEDTKFRAKRDRWITLQKQIEEEEDYELISTLKAEHINFDFGWDAIINAPKINIVDKDTQNLSLEISFKSGSLFYRPDKLSAVNQYDLSKCVYAFNVPIGKLSINKDQMIMEAKTEMENVIRESGLSDHDFTIESLFLNFENANITTFDKNKSTFPSELTLPLQVAIQNYFNLMLAGSNNTYILGYGVSRKNIAPSEKAMFQPTSLNFSTSYSTRQDKVNPVKGQFSSFNFLMMVNNRVPVYNQNTGVLPASLIELGKDTSSTTDGVFAIQSDRFNTYVESVDEYVASIFSSQKGVTLDKGGFYDTTDGRRVLLARHSGKRIDDTIDTLYALRRETVSNNKSPAGIKITYVFQVIITVEINAKIFDNEIHLKKISLSTAGKYTKGDIKKKGALGSLTFIVKNGKEGRFDLDYKLTPPVIAYDKDPNIYKDGFWSVLLAIVTFIFTWPVKLVEGIINQIALDLGSTNVTSENKKIEKLRNLDVLNQTNKVILPLGKIYTYKNLRYIDDKGIVGYDISYAPVIEK